MKIYTITSNPAYDIHASADHFEACHENLAVVTSREAGGKGVNISRALCNYGIANTAVVVLGKDNCSDFCNDIAYMDTIYFERPGRIRENLTLHCANAPETRISFRGFTIDDSILPQISDRLQVDADTVITFTGRVPDGMTMDAVKDFLKGLQLRGARIVLDSKSFSFEDICQVKPWLIKPNEEEIAQYLNCAVKDLSDVAEKAKVFAEGGVENVMVSMGGEGAILLTEGKTYVANAPTIEPLSTIGAGDSAIAGFITAAQQEPALRLKTAVAFGSAACMTYGTQPPKKETVETLLKTICVEIK